MKTATALPHVVVIGAGFGGLKAVQTLAKAPVRITLLDQRNYHLFQPLLYQVATAGLSPEDIAHSVRGILRDQKNADFRMTKVTSIDLKNKQVLTTTGQLTYDYLIIATGGVTNFFGMESVAQNAYGLKNIDEALTIRNHILRQFELASQESDPAKRQAMLTFAIVGGGPTGVESAGALSELIYQVLGKDRSQILPDEPKILLIEATSGLLSMLSPKLQAETKRKLEEKQVQVCLNTAVTAYDKEKITLKSGEILPCRTLIWAAGIRASLVADTLDTPKGPGARLVTTPTLQLPAYPEVFAVGDTACVEHNGRPLPTVAPVALQEGETAAKNILLLIKKSPLKDFQYKDKGSLTTIGRNSAVGQVFDIPTTGFIAWFLWSFVHIMGLIGYRNRFLVFIKWAWDYFAYVRAARLITREE